MNGRLSFTEYLAQPLAATAMRNTQDTPPTVDVEASPPADDLPFGGLVDDAIAELELHRQKPKLGRRRRRCGFLLVG